MGVGHFDAETLEEFLVDGVEEVLFFAVVFDGGGGGFDGAVEAVEAVEEVGAAETAAGEGADDFLYFAGDDVALGEVGVVEDFAEDALGEQVLDEHFFDGVVGEVGVDGVAHERFEVGEGGC